MQNLRTIGWVILTAIVVAFVIMNFGERHEVKFWPGSDGGGLLFEWPVGFIALVFFLLGFAPMWLIHRAHKWSTARRIASLENAARTVAATPVAVTPKTDPAPAPAPAPEPETPLQPDAEPAAESAAEPKADEGKEPGTLL